MEYIIWILLIVGLAGAVLPALPGPLLTALAFILYLFTQEPDSTTFLWMFTVLGLLIFVADYLMPGWIAKAGGGSKYASRGAIIGLLLSLVTGPGMVLGAFLGASIGEYLHTNEVQKSIKSGFLATVGLFTGMVLKVIYCVAGIVYYALL